MEKSSTFFVLSGFGAFATIVALFAAFSFKGGAKNDVPALTIKDSGQIWVSSSVSSSSQATQIDSLKGDYSFGQTGDIGQSGLAFQNDPTISDMLSGGSDVQNSLSSNVSGAFVDSDSSNAETSSSSSSIGNDNVVTAVNENTQKAMDETAAAKQEIRPVSVPTTTTKPKTVESTSTAKASSSTSAKATTSSTTTKTASTAKTQTTKTSSTSSSRYWVQVSSYSTKNNADEARAVLEKKAIPCEVFTFEKDGSLFYRVRVGPYSTKSEAEYWVNQVKAVPMFKTVNPIIYDAMAKSN